MFSLRCRRLEVVGARKTGARGGDTRVSLSRARNVLPKCIEICIETPCWCPSGWAPTWRLETNRNICHRVLLQKREFISRRSHKHERNTFSKTWIPENVAFLTYITTLGSHVNAASRKSLEIQAYSITKPRTHSKWKFVWKLVFSYSNTSWK